MCSPDVINLLPHDDKGLSDEAKAQIKILKDRLELRKDSIEAALMKLKENFRDLFD
jgi:hypothetical protein